MLRSYHYAAHTAVADLVSRGVIEPGVEVGAPSGPPGTSGATGSASASHGRQVLSAGRYREAADRFAFWAGAAYLGGYLPLIRETGLVPEDDGELGALLQAHLLDKALYEVRYELGNRPEWVHLPLYGLRFLLGPTGSRPDRPSA